jgi:hypothetical protein
MIYRLRRDKQRWHILVPSYGGDRLCSVVLIIRRDAIGCIVTGSQFEQDAQNSKVRTVYPGYLYHPPRQYQEASGEPSSDEDLRPRRIRVPVKGDRGVSTSDQRKFKRGHLREGGKYR